MKPTPYEKQMYDEAKSRILGKLPYMENDNKRRAKRTMRFIDKRLKGSKVVW